MKLILPMAGDGLRFKNYAKVPKYLIDVAGEPMLRRGLKGCEFRPEEIVAVVRSEHCEIFGAEEKIRAELGKKAAVVRVEPTRGAAETVLLGLSGGNCTSEEAICVKDVDCISVPAKGWRWNIEEALKREPKAAVCWVAARDDGLGGDEKKTNKSHLRADAEGNLLEIREKVRCSPLFVAGYYLFSSAAVFAAAAEAILNRPQGGECYLSHVVSHILKTGGSARILPILEYHDLGTPEALKVYLEAR